MNRDLPQLLTLDLVLESAREFGLTEEEIRDTALEFQFRCWMDPSEETAELADELAGALSRAILRKQRRIFAERRVR